jgi:murein DD-endopeptidase MepM/ murein hydrolase activator NlpD
MATIKVKKGETLRDIAAKAGISIKDLIALNPEIKSPDIKPGQVINISDPTGTDAIIQQYADAASGETYLKGRYGPGSGLSAPGTIATQATPVTATPAVPVTTAAATGTATPIAANEDENIAEAIAAGNQAIKDANEVISSLEPAGATGPTGGRTIVSTFINPATGDTYALYSDGTRELLFKGTKEADAATAAAAETLAAEQAATLAAEAKTNDGRSAYSLLLSEFDEYGLGALVEPLKKFIEEGLSPAEFTIRLRETDAYKKRFSANAQRVAKGLRALSEAQYISKEDAYQDVMRRYGLPESYYARGDMGIQEGFEKLIGNDVSDVELEDRVQTAQNRVVNSNPEVAKALKEFYPGISNGDILAYVLDPANAIEQIKRKVTAAEIGGAAIQSGLKTGMTRAEELAAAGVNKAQAQEGFGTISGGLQRGSQLASIYGEDAYNQTTAEQEVFRLTGSTEARNKRQKITGLEKATFGGQSGASSTAISRDRAGAF